jgi:hypothetical protein
MLSKFGKKLFGALCFAYPDILWDEKKFSFKGKKASQRWLLVNMKKLVPGDTEIFEEFFHPKLKWGAFQFFFP